MRKTIATIGTLFGTPLGTVMLMLTGCSLQTEDASKFRQPIPESSQVALGIAGSPYAATTTTQAAPKTALTVQSGPGSGGGVTTAGDASYYQFTRSITDSVDTVTVAILGEVGAVMSLPPTTIDANHAVWGPGSSDALDPVTWRLTVTATGGGEYSYEVDGRPHLSTSDADWQAILTGQGYDATSPSYKTGTFTVNNDAMRALDPTQTGTGTVSITYDARAYPVNATADVLPNDGTGQSYDVTVQHASDGSGVMTLNAVADVSTPPSGVNENVRENSRWDSTGAGRADVSMTGGQFGSTTVLVSQCWSDAFAQTYYTDSVNYEPTAGDPASCAFTQASFAD
jgi:hypothetical protein